MRALSLFALSALTVAMPGLGDEPTAARVRSVIEQAMSARGIGPLSGPGCAFSVTRAEQTLFSGGYGAADIEHGVPFETRTVSESGSVAKQFMAAAIFMLAERGSLSLTDDIRTYLPEVPDYGKTIRIFDLIYQTSGIREWSTLAALQGHPRAYRKIYTLDDLFRIVAAQRALNFEPGTRYEYSNSNYGLLTVILERVSGMSAREFSERHLFAPLGMHSTQWRDDHRRLVPNRAIAYRRTASGFEHAMPMEDVYGHGALLTTVEDMQRWNSALLNGALSEFVTRHLLTPGKLRNGEERLYGGGIRLGEFRGRTAYRHAGVTAGYNAQLWAFPQERVSIAYLCNVSLADSGEVAANIAAAALGLEPQRPVAPASSVKPDVKAIGVPTYFISAGGEMIAVATQGERTFVNMFNRAGFVEVTPGEHNGVLTAHQPNYGTLEVRFDGRDRVIASLDHREPIAYSKMAPTAAGISIEGRYTNADLGADYEIRRQADGYRMELVNARADDPLAFRLERLNGDVYFAHLETRSGYIRDDFVVAFSRTGLTISSVAGLQAVDLLAFDRVSEKVR